MPPLTHPWLHPEMGLAMQEDRKAQQHCQGDPRSRGCWVPIEAASGATVNTLAVQSL